MRAVAEKAVAGFRRSVGEGGLLKEILVAVKTEIRHGESQQGLLTRGVGIMAGGAFAGFGGQMVDFHPLEEIVVAIKTEGGTGAAQQERVG